MNKVEFLGRPVFVREVWKLKSIPARSMTRERSNNKKEIGS